MADVLSVRAQRVSGSGGPTTVVIMTALLLLSDLTTAKPKCKPGWYYDQVTGNCDHCSDICDNAEAMRTINECERKCPEYRKADTKQKSGCPPQHYYDDNVDRCHSCDSLCLHAATTGTETDCNNLCPNWSGISDIATKSSRNISAVPNRDIDQSPLLYVDVTSILVAVFALILSLLVSFLTVAVIVWHCKRRNKLNKETCNKRPQQVEHNESHELESLTARGDPLAHPHDDEQNFCHNP